PGRNMVLPGAATGPGDGTSGSWARRRALRQKHGPAGRGDGARRRDVRLLGAATSSQAETWSCRARRRRPRREASLPGAGTRPPTGTCASRARGRDGEGGGEQVARERAAICRNTALVGAAGRLGAATPAGARDPRATRRNGGFASAAPGTRARTA